MTLDMFQIEAIDEVFYVIAMDEQSAKAILNGVESIMESEIDSVNKMTIEQIRERTIMTDEDIELPEMNMFDYYRTYSGNGEIIASTLYNN